jgi:hypothetical protein
MGINTKAELRISIEVEISPEGDFWQKGLTKTTKYIQMPIFLFEPNDIAKYLYKMTRELQSEIENELKKEKENDI